MSHYYSEEQDIASNEQTIVFEMQGKSLQITTDNGVFSKGGIDFGSKTLINAFLNEGNEAGILLDVGCGYGTIGLMVKKHQPSIDITMVDVNERALLLAQKNAKQNQLEATVIKSSVYDQVEGDFDYILTNPPIRAGKQVVHEILEGSFNHLNDNGAIYVVIQKKQGMPSAKKKLEEVFGNVEVIDKAKGYYILKSIKG